MKRTFLASLCCLVAILCSGAKKTTITVSLAFSNGNTALPWPFAEKKVSTTVKAASFPSEETYFTVAKGGQKFKMLATKGISINTKSGLGLGMSVGDYIELPTIDGMALTAVTIVCGRPGNMAMPSIVLADGSPVKGGELQESSFETGGKLEWKLEGLKPSTTCRIVAGANSLMCIHSVDLTYTGTVKKVKAPKSKFKTVTLNFKDPDTGAAVWPFSTKKHTAGVKITDADMVTDNLDEFSVKCSDKAYLHPNGAYTFGKGKYNYLMLPSFGTRALAKVEMYVPKSGKNGCPAIMNQYKWNIVEGGDAAASISASEPYVWELSNTEPGERYRIVLTVEGGCSIEKLVLYYKK